MMPKLLILGHARHGKDSFAEILRDDFGLNFMSSSQAAADIFIFDALKDLYGYETPEQCFEDRVNHRQEWYEMICDYNKGDRAKLAKGILKIADCYVGMRDHEEFIASKDLFDLIIYVDAEGREKKEKLSFNISKEDADFVISNKTTLSDFETKSIRLGKLIFNF